MADGVRNLLWKTAGLTGVFVVTYVGTALSGQVMVESARRQQINAQERALNAGRAEAVLRKHVYALMDRKQIDGWASTHGLVPPDTMVVTKPTAEETGAAAATPEAPTAPDPDN